MARLLRDLALAEDADAAADGAPPTAFFALLLDVPAAVLLLLLPFVEAVDAGMAYGCKGGSGSQPEPGPEYVSSFGHSGTLTGFIHLPLLPAPRFTPVVGGSSGGIVHGRTKSKQSSKKGAEGDRGADLVYIIKQQQMRKYVCTVQSHS